MVGLKELTMWTKIRLKNFRLYQDTRDIALAPLTVFIGPNGGGKSTLLKAFLLPRQSVESRDLKTPIVPDGPYCELGLYDDYILKGDINSDLDFQLQWKTIADAENAGHDASFDVQWSYDGNFSRVLVKELEYRFRGKRSIAATRNSNGGYGLGSERKDLQKNRLPSIAKLIRFYGTSSELANRLEVSPSFLSHLNWLENELQRQISATYYLGPLRERPRQFYPIPQVRPSDAGIMGERAGDIMFFDDNNIREQVSKWAKAIGIADKVSVNENSDSYTIEFANVTMKYKSNISNAAFGAPQSLPILVQGLYQEPESTFLLEQPEIHLNPRTHAEMADFFIRLAKDKKHRKQLIIETHSEHILNRIRTMVSEGKLKPDMVAVYFCDATKSGGRSKRLNISEFGQFDNWPEGFFAEEIEEALEQSRAVFKRNKKLSGNK